MDIEKLAKVLQAEPRFRLRQAKQAIFKNLISDWQEAVSLPGNLRLLLNQECPLGINADILTAKGGQSLKAVIILADGLRTETVLMKHEVPAAIGRRIYPERSRRTVCVSSQVGCPIGCLFCLTGQAGLKRNLRVMEMVEQVLLWARWLKKSGERVSNVVFMGMGEPLLNYDNVLEAIRILNDKGGLNIGVRHISISTVGIPESIKRLAREKIKPNLAISLHAVNDVSREKIIPFNKCYPLAALQKAVDDYLVKTKQRVTFEYLMLDGYNDTDRDAKELVRFIKGFKRPFEFPSGRNFYFVNLIAYNPIPAERQSDFYPSRPERIQKFKAILQESGIEVVQRYKFGRDIKAACGQLALKSD